MYVRRRLLGTKSQKRTPQHTTRDLAQILALLGRSEAFASLKSLADAANNGALAHDEATVEDIRAAREDLAEIKSMLKRALRTKAR